MTLGEGDPRWWGRQTLPQYAGWNPYYPAPARPFVTLTSTSSFVQVERFYTWREAIIYASRINWADSRISLRRDGDQWAVRWTPRLVRINGAA